MRKIISREKLKEKVDALKSKGQTIIFTNGCFDILHAGHTRYLNAAKDIGDILILALNSDSSIRSIKGEKRPIVSQNDRACVLSSLESVNYVIMFDEETPLELIEYIKPHILVKGGDWSEEDVVGRDSVKKWGGRVVIIPQVESASTTGIIEKILDVYKTS